MTTATKKTIYGVTLKPRVILRPKDDAKVNTINQKKDVVDSARKVISTHRKVLEALRDR